MYSEKIAVQSYLFSFQDMQGSMTNFQEAEQEQAVLLVVTLLFAHILAFLIANTYYDYLDM